MNLRHRTILFLLLLFSSPAFSGEPVIQIHIQTGYRIPYRMDGDIRYRPGNEIVKELARVVLKEPWFVEVNVSATLALTVWRYGTTDSLEVRSSKPVVRGDTVYRGFGVSHELTPNRFNLRLRWASRADTSSYSEQDIFGVDDSKLMGGGYRIPVGLFDPETDTILLEQFEGYYDSTGYSRFMERIGLIHNYFASVAMLDSLRISGSKIDLSNLSSLPVHYFTIEEMNHALECIDSLHFHEYLLSTGYDPLSLEQSYRNCYREARSLTYNFIDAVKKEPDISWNGHTGALTRFFSDRIYSYIKRSQWMDNLQGTIYNRYVKTLPFRSPFPEDSGITGLLLARMYPQADPDTLHRFFIRSLCSTLIERSDSLAHEKLFTEAFAMAEFSRALALNNGLNDYSGIGEQRMRLCGEGILNAYVGIASGCINSGRYTMADTYLTKAGDYIDNNRRWINSDELYRAEFARLFFMRNRDCDSLLAGQRFREALECYRQFELRYPEHDVAVLRDELEKKKQQATMGLYAESVRLTARALKAGENDSALVYDERATVLRKQSHAGGALTSKQDSIAGKIALLRYDRCVEEGTAALDKRLFTLALSRFDEALDIALFYHVNPAEEFDSLYRRAARHYLIIQLSSTQKLIWANLFDSAMASLEHTEKSAKAYGLQDDMEVLEATGRYRDKIEIQRCRNLTDTLVFHAIKADRARANLNYIQAVEGYKVCEAIANASLQCHFSPDQYRDSLDRYTPASVYQQVYAETGHLIAAGSYYKAFMSLIQANELFLKGQIGRYGLPEPVIPAILTDRANPWLTIEAVKYYYASGKQEEALRYLQLLARQGMEPGMAREIQEKVAMLKATGDMKITPGADPKALLSEYTSVDPWYRAFRTTYLKTWKEAEKK